MTTVGSVGPDTSSVYTRQADGHYDHSYTSFRNLPNYAWDEANKTWVLTVYAAYSDEYTLEFDLNVPDGRSEDEITNKANIVPITGLYYGEWLTQNQTFSTAVYIHGGGWGRYFGTYKPELAGYRFRGWSWSQSPGSAFSGESFFYYSYVGQPKMYAVWEKIGYVFFHANVPDGYGYTTQTPPPIPESYPYDPQYLAPSYLPEYDVDPYGYTNADVSTPLISAGGYDDLLIAPTEFDRNAEINQWGGGANVELYNILRGAKQYKGTLGDLVLEGWFTARTVSATWGVGMGDPPTDSYTYSYTYHSNEMQTGMYSDQKKEGAAFGSGYSTYPSYYTVEEDGAFNLHLYAHWIPQPYLYYDDNLPEEATQEQLAAFVPTNTLDPGDDHRLAIDIGASYSSAPGFGKVTNPRLPGYIFVRWLTASNSYFYASNTVTGDTEIKAQWAEAATLTLDHNLPGDANVGSLIPMAPTIYTVGKGVSFSDGDPTLQLTLQNKWPKLSGYGFIGWYYENGNQFSVYDTCAENTTIYAKWGKLVPVAFDMNLGQGVTDTTLVPTAKTVVTATAGLRATSTEYGNNAELYGILQNGSRPSRGEFDFAGWATDADDKNSKITWEWTVPENGTTLYALWEPAVFMRFDPNVPENDANPVLPDNTPYAARAGSSGGYRDPYYYVFERNKDALPFTRGGYIVTGWYNNPGLTEPFYVRDTNGSTQYWSSYWDTMNGDKTIYAKWAAAYTLTFDSNTTDPTVFNAHPPEITVPVGFRWGDYIISQVEPERKEYFFLGWYNEPNGVTEFDSSTTAAGDKTVYAKWEKLGKLTLDLNTPDANAVLRGANEIRVKTGRSYNYDYAVVNQLDAARPTRPGYSFAGWYLDKACTTPFDTNAAADAERTIYADWIAGELILTLDVNADGDTVTGELPGPFPLNYGSDLAYGQDKFSYYTFNELAIFRAGYTFTGRWHIGSPSGDVWSYETTSSVLATGSVTLYAEWAAGETRITLDKNNTDSGSTEANPSSVQYNVRQDYYYRISLQTPLSKIAKPTRAGYKFTGWYTDANASVKFRADDSWQYEYQIPETLFAGWEAFEGELPPAKDIITVAFAANAQGGAVAGMQSSVEVPAGTGVWDVYSVTDVLYSSRPTREGYAFDYWSEDPDGTSDWYNWFYSHDAFDEDVTFYAVWTPANVKLTFDINIAQEDLTGREVYPEPEEVWVKSNINNVDSPTRPGYEFVDWYLEPECRTRWNWNIPARDTTYYALWRPVNDYDPLSVLYIPSNISDLTQDEMNSIGYDQYIIKEGELAGRTMFTPTRASEQEFLGWYLHDKLAGHGLNAQRYAYTDAGTRITETTPLTADMASLENTIILFGHWSNSPPAASGTVSYNANYPGGGSPAPTEEAHSFGTIALKSVEDLGFSAAGFAFLGWFTEPVGGKEVTSAVLSAENPDIEVYAHWKSDTFRVFLEDHVKYVAGYPDGTVRPNGNITRAEVAVILYSVLTPGMRAQYETAHNPFPDVPNGAWYTKAVLTVANIGLMTGYPDGAFGPDRAISRAEVGTMAGGKKGLVTILNAPEVEQNKAIRFPDVPEGQWFTAAVYRAVVAGYFFGDENGNFRPAAKMTRAEFMTFMNRVLERLPERQSDLLPGMRTFPDNTDKSDWYYLDVQEATNAHNYERKQYGNPKFSFKYEKWVALR